MRHIYLDHNATSPLDPAVLDAMRPHLLAAGNAESRHAFGRSARRAVDAARASVASILNADPSEVVFTSGGTEADNLAIFGLAEVGDGPRHVVVSPLEHPAVDAAIDRLQLFRFAVDRPKVGLDGVADPESMVAAMTSKTCLAALMLANNETGAIQPVAKLASLAAAKGVPVHCDAAQAVGRIEVDFRALGVATLAASAHKFQGPAGVGLLLVRRGVRLDPWIVGGGQQRGVRPGTMPVGLIVGLARALEIRHERLIEQAQRWRSLRDRLETLIRARLGTDRVVRHGPTDEALRLPQTLNLAFPGVDGDALLMQLDVAEVAASLGSACASGSTRPSPTLVAMGVPRMLLRSSVRFSLGPEANQDLIDDAGRRIADAVDHVSKFDPDSAAALAST